MSMLDLPGARGADGDTPADMRSRETSCMVQSEDFPRVLLTNLLVTHSSHPRLKKKKKVGTVLRPSHVRKNACCVDNFMLNVVSCLQTRRSEGNRFCLKAQLKKYPS